MLAREAVTFFFQFVFLETVLQHCLIMKPVRVCLCVCVWVGGEKKKNNDTRLREGKMAQTCREYFTETDEIKVSGKLCVWRELCCLVSRFRKRVNADNGRTSQQNQEVSLNSDMKNWLYSVWFSFHFEKLL